MLHWTGPDGPTPQAQPLAMMGFGGANPQFRGSPQQAYSPNPSYMMPVGPAPGAVHGMMAQPGRQLMSPMARGRSSSAESNASHPVQQISPQQLAELRRQVAQAEEEVRQLKEFDGDQRRLHEALEEELSNTRSEAAKHKEDTAGMRKADNFFIETEAKLRAGKIKEKELTALASKYAEGVPPPPAAFANPPVEAEPWVLKAAAAEFEIERAKHSLESALDRKARLQRTDREDRRRLLALRNQVRVLQEVYERIDTHLQDCQAADGSFDPENVVVSLAHLFVPMIEFQDVDEAVAALQAIARGGQPPLVPTKDNRHIMQKPPSLPGSSPPSSRPLINATESQLPLSRSLSAPSIPKLAGSHHIRDKDIEGYPPSGKDSGSIPTTPNSPTRILHSKPDAEAIHGYGNAETPSRGESRVPPVVLQKSSQAGSNGKSFMPTEALSGRSSRTPLGERQLAPGQFPALLPTETRLDVSGMTQQLVPSKSSIEKFRTSDKLPLKSQGSHDEIPISEEPLPLPPRSSSSVHREPLSEPITDGTAQAGPGNVIRSPAISHQGAALVGTHAIAPAGYGAGRKMLNRPEAHLKLPPNQVPSPLHHVPMSEYFAPQVARETPERERDAPQASIRYLA